MTDDEIVALFWQRSEDAIAEAKKKYHAYCQTIACNILASYEDAEEVVADTWLRAWNSIPPTRPVQLKAYLGRITHNLAINRYRANTRQPHSELTEALGELEITQLEDPAEQAQRLALAEAVARFLRGLDSNARQAFVLRYWYYDSLAAISRQTGIKETTLNSMLYRTRKKLKAYLKKEGWTIEKQ